MVEDARVFTILLLKIFYLPEIVDNLKTILKTEVLTNLQEKQQQQEEKEHGLCPEFQIGLELFCPYLSP